MQHPVCSDLALPKLKQMAVAMQNADCSSVSQTKHADGGWLSLTPKLQLFAALLFVRFVGPPLKAVNPKKGSLCKLLGLRNVAKLCLQVQPCAICLFLCFSV